MKRVFLQNNRAFSWNSSENCFVKGYFFDKTGGYYSNEKLLSYFEEVDSFSDFEERVRYANGSFSVVVKKDDDLFIAVDKIRSLPLFYARMEGSWIVSDNPYYIVGKANLSEKNSQGVSEFLATGYVTGNETLVEGLRQVQASEIIHLKKDDLFSKFYYSFRVSDTIDDEYKDMKAAGIRVFENSFSRLVTSLEGKTAVIPLSGGYDSRFIATMLKKLDYENVICFTYGRKGNPEIRISREVAERLGYKWYYIEYNDDLIKNYIKENVFHDYYRFASNLSSMFYMQEYFAVKHLKENNLIPEDSVFIPGHSGDFLGGSQLNKHGNLNLEEDDKAMVQRIYNVKYCLKKPTGKEVNRTMERINRSLNEKFQGKKSFAYSIHEDWDFKEKLAKFNFNSITTYTFFDYEFRLPYWDNELLDFFKYLPLHAKINKYLYDDILTNHFFAEKGLNFKEKLQLRESDVRMFKLKTRIKKHLPESVKRFFMKSRDGIYYNEITRAMKNDLEKKGIRIKVHGNSYNSLIVQWYMHQIEEILQENKP
jgi:asparagine synthase (glutamine-hydrolysing)